MTKKETEQYLEEKDEIVDVNKSDNTEEDIIKQNELDELSKFMS